MQRSLISGILIAIACSLLGVFLVLRKNAFIGEGLAHISFGGIAVGLLIGINPMIAALIVTIIGALMIVNIDENSKLSGDTSIGIFSYTGFALGILLISLKSGFNTDLFSYLFGNILALTNFDVFFSLGLVIIVLVFIVLFRQELFYITFDEETAKTAGINVRLLNYLIAVLVGITVVVSMRIVGIILVASFIILPASAALQISKNFKQTLFYSLILSILSVITGLILSFYLDIAAGATVVLVNFIFFVVLYFLGKNHS